MKYIKSVITLIILIILNNSFNSDESNLINNKLVIKSDSIKNNEFSLANLDIDYWNMITNEYINYYSICGTKNEQPLKILWSLVENGRYRKNLFTSISKEFNKTVFLKNVYVVEIITLSSSHLAPKVIYIFDDKTSFGLFISKIDNTNEISYKSERLSKAKMQELLGKISKLKQQTPYFCVNNTRGNEDFHYFELISKLNKKSVKIIFGELTYSFK